MNGSHTYADVSLPVPLEQSFTYLLPETLRHRVQPGCRLLVPFGSRKLTGMVLHVHDDPPEQGAREALRLLDEQPVLDAHLLALGRWIASYYCAPPGEVLRGMVPLAGEIRRGRIYSLTDAGRDAARQFVTTAEPEDKVVRVLKLLEARPLSATWLAKKVEKAADAIRALEKKGFVQVEDVEAERDPLRASAVRLRVEFAARPGAAKLPKAERELLSYLELHPGDHNLASLEETVRHASQAARSLARKKLVNLRPENPAQDLTPFQAAHTLNPHQQEAFDRIHEAIQTREFRPFLLQGVTGSGKTEVYLRAIETAMA
ncbi:MAG: DEAD/DEAH box helicase family protein, partial [Bryobacteraceae bacterium]